MLNQNDQVYKINDIVFYYRIRENSMLRETNHEKYLEILRYIYHKHWVKYISVFGDPLTSYTKNLSLGKKKQNNRVISFCKKAIEYIKRIK